MRVQCQTIGKVKVIEVLLESLDADTAKDFREDMKKRLAGGDLVVFDMDRVRFVDSSGLGAILTCLRQINAGGGDLKLCNLTPEVRAMFELVRMHRVIEIHGTKEEAVQAF